MATLSRAAGTPAEGAETTCGLGGPADRSDYLSALNDRLEHPAPTRTMQCTGEEIVHSRWKHRGRVNPLVVGSNPTGPIVHPCSLRSTTPCARRAAGNTPAGLYLPRERPELHYFGEVTCGRALLGAGPVDCRKVSVDGSMCSVLSAGSPRKVRSNSSAASPAISEMGCRIVVSAGHT
jgi:hypothetical protein